MDDQIISWAKTNKKRLVKAYLSSQDFISHEKPAAVFMAGVPGAGKTEFAKRLIPRLTNPPLHIDMDEIATHFDMYKPKIAHLFRSGATIILERLFDQAIKQKIDILMDGTLSHDKSIQNIERALRHGYSVRVYFIYSDPVVAWQKTKDRETIEDRAINSEGFINTYFKLLKNLEVIGQRFGKSVPISIVVKDSENRLKDIIEEVSNITNFTEAALTREELADRMKA